MRRHILTALAVLALTAPARAYDLNINFTMAPYMNFGRTSAKIINIQPPLSDADRVELEAQDRKWVAFCQPVKRVDDFGMTRLTYAHDGCDLGRSE
jgi:hypothetical protein